MKNIPDAFLTTPIVYAVKDNYQITVPVSCETMMWVKVGDETFFDDSNGILRSSCMTHKMTVPAELLNREKKYTVCFRRIIERKPYFTDAGEVEYYESSFRPIEKSLVNMYQVADAHNDSVYTVKAGSYYKEGLDLLILNGDIPNHSGKIEYFTTIHKIASELTDGEIPVIFSRGNHDLRGIYAEKIEDHTPTDNGRSYFTFRLGHVWGVVLDCAEDKSDDHAEYGHTICCEDFRKRETKFLKKIIENAKEEYEAPGVKNRLVIVHNPFTQTLNPPFDIEQETFTEWARLLREHVKPQLMISGHIHDCYISEVGSPKDHKGQPCPLVVVSQNGTEKFIGGAFTLYEDKCRVIFNSSDGEISGDSVIEFK